MEARNLESSTKNIPISDLYDMIQSINFKPVRKLLSEKTCGRHK